MGVTIKSRQVVKPAEPTWTGVLPLSELDQTSFITHTPIIYIYNKPTQNSEKIIESVIDSLSRVLVPFFPVAGRVSWAEDRGGRFELECNAFGAEFIEAESTHQVTDFGDFSSPYGAMFDGLVPEVDYTNTPLHELPILFVQLTWFRCGGICIGTSLSHVIADGHSLFHFLREFAKLTRDGNGSLLDSVPYLNRRIIEDSLYHKQGSRVTPAQRQHQHQHQHQHHDDVDQFTRLPIVLGEENDMEQRKKETVSQNFVLTKEQIATLKKVAAENNHHSRVPYTRFEVITSHIWRCASKARGHTTEQMTAACLLIDSRSRFHPPLPPSYFGDAVVIEVEQSEAGELISRPLSDTCQKIREKKEKTMSNDYTRSVIKHLKAQNPVFKYQERAVFEGPQGVFFGNPNLTVSSLLNFSVRNLDFGWGREVYMGTATQQFDGDVVIFPGYENDGSVVVSVGLQVQHRLPVRIIQGVQWYLGLPDDFLKFPECNLDESFRFVDLEDGERAIAVDCGEKVLAILQNNAIIRGECNGGWMEPISLPLFPSKGSRLKRKILGWLDEFQKLPYVSPYEDISHLNPDSDIAEKRVVGVLHELLSLFVDHAAQRKKLLCLKKYLQLPQKFHKAFERHPHIFYLSLKANTCTAILKEAYRDETAVKRHPLSTVRMKYVELMKDSERILKERRFKNCYASARNLDSESRSDLD